jgi:hypothetical protein
MFVDAANLRPFAGSEHGRALSHPPFGDDDVYPRRRDAVALATHGTFQPRQGGRVAANVISLGISFAARSGRW